MSLGMSLYALKMHSATQYENFAYAVKPYSVALSNMINEMSKQDKKHAELLHDANCADVHEDVIDTIHILALHIDDDIDRDPIDVARDVVFQMLDNEDYTQKIMKKYQYDKFYVISFYRHNKLLLVKKYIENNGIFYGDKGELWQCSVCGHFHKSSPQKPYAPDECPCCLAKQAAFIRNNEIGVI